MNKQCSNKSQLSKNPSYICNSMTGRWVHKDGVLGKMLLSVKPEKPLCLNDIMELKTSKLEKYKNHPITIFIRKKSKKADYLVTVNYGNQTLDDFYSNSMSDIEGTIALLLDEFVGKI